jgi:hypothetical protein
LLLGTPVFSIFQDCKELDSDLSIYNVVLQEQRLQTEGGGVANWNKAYHMPTAAGEQLSMIHHFVANLKLSDRTFKVDESYSSFQISCKCATIVQAPQSSLCFA